MRDSKRPHGPVLVLATTVWDAWVTARSDESGAISAGDSSQGVGEGERRGSGVRPQLPREGSALRSAAATSPDPSKEAGQR
ncbi:DUF397 domain-containing protein [Streptomyces sp. NBC_00102]|uniref:DUF397 domain-containing protein n=1 Tax=Streptomyces sp. NBC_00102 TaxID=2975652 RepID=UPI002B1E83C9|nr:DUF397 domain-containing protein [Streptomyces sp. NBC_00102]